MSDLNHFPNPSITRDGARMRTRNGSLRQPSLPFHFPCPPPFQNNNDSRSAFLEFFAGSGLVGHALSPYFKTAWANDVCPKKAAVFKANHEDAPFDLESVTEVNGNHLPPASLSWSSFPCQDLSLAGNGEGIQGERSGLGNINVKPLKILMCFYYLKFLCQLINMGVIR